MTPESATSPHQPKLVRPYNLARVVLLAILGSALLLGAVLWGPSMLLGPRVDVYAVTRQPLVQSVVASGRVEAPHRVAIGAEIIAVVQSVPVEEGAHVAAGQLLLALEAAELRAAAAQARAAVDSAQARLRQLREVQAPVAEQALRQAQVTLANAQRQLARQVDLLQQGFIGLATVDEQRKTVDLAAAQQQSAQVQAATVQPLGSDYAVALTSLAQAQASADVAASRLRHATIQAPVAGVLIRRDVEPGDVVQPGRTLMSLSPDGQSQLVAQIDERNLGLLRIGQAAQASADAYADRCFAAELVSISPGIDAQRGAVEVKLLVPQPPGELRQDMTVSVDIQVGFRSQALVVPVAALHEADGIQPWVLVAAQGRLHRREVSLGLRAGALVEVVQGLSPGELIVPSPDERVAGARVRPVLAAPPTSARPCLAAGAAQR